MYACHLTAEVFPTLRRVFQVEKKLLATLFSINLVMSAVGSSIGVLIPVFAAQLGASADQIGLFMSAAFTGLAGGTLVGGRFSDRHAYRKSILIAACSMAVVSNWLTGQSENIGQLVLFSVGYHLHGRDPDCDGQSHWPVPCQAGLNAGASLASWGPRAHWEHY